MKILIADDSALILAQLEDMLSEAGFEVTVTKDGQQAWDVLSQGEIRLAVLDWMMPEMTGTDICRRLIADPALQSVYAILLTGKVGEKAVEGAFDAGASDYLPKPVCQVELLARVRAGKRIVELQSRLAQSQKMESIGQLAAGIAHEINTPIQYIADNSRFLQDTFGSFKEVLDQYGQMVQALQNGDSVDEQINGIHALIDQIDLEFLLEETPRAVEESIEGAGRVAKIVSAMKGFSQPSSGAMSSVDLHGVLTDTVTITKNQWHQVADVATHFDAALPLVPCKRTDMNQVFLNLIINAADAILDVVGPNPEEKGQITIRTRLLEDEVEICVEDNGCGIPEQNRERVFDPFFTSKDVGQGTGQGLTVAHQVVSGHSGSIEFESRVGAGTVFRVRLPCQPTHHQEHGDRQICSAT